MEVVIIYDFLDSAKIYAKVDEIRKANGLTIHSMAKKAGVSCASIYKWRDRHSTPSLALLESLSEVLGVHIINLLIKDNELVCLTEWQRSVFDRISTLTDNQKQLLDAFINVLQKENSLN